MGYQNKLLIYAIILALVTYSVADPGGGGGGGRIGRLFFGRLLFLSGFFLCVCVLVTPEVGLLYSWMVPLHNNVNDGIKNSGGKMCRSTPPPPPHWATFSGVARHQGISGPPFSEILDPPLVLKDILLSRAWRQISNDHYGLGGFGFQKLPPLRLFKSYSPATNM